MRKHFAVCLVAMVLLGGCWSRGSQGGGTEPASTATAPDKAKEQSAARGGTPKVRPECVDITRAFESALTPLDEDQPLQNLTAIRKAADEAGEDPASCVRERVETLLKRERDKLVWLSIAGTRVAESMSIYTCAKLEDKFRCPGYTADDTTHSLELPISPLSRKAADAMQVQLRDGYRPGSVRVFQVLTHEGDPLPVERAADGTLKLDDFTEGARIFFALIQEPGGYVKYVWVVKGTGA